MRGRTIARWALGVIGLLVVLAVAALLVLTGTDWGRERVRRIAVAQLNKIARGRVNIARMDGNLLGGATLTGVSITDSAGRPFLAADTIEASYGIGSILRKRIVLSGVRLVRPVVVLDQPPGGQWNYAVIFPRDTTKRAPTPPGFGSWIALRDVTVVDGRVTVRAPWAPSDTLTPAQRDSVVHVALGPKGRPRIERVPGGFQRVAEFRDIYGNFPLLRLADPNDPRQIIDVASLRMTAEPMRPPAVRVTDARGRFLIRGDSLYFDNVRAALSASRLGGSGRYRFSNNDLWLRLRGDTVSTNDLLWIDPTIPENGTGKLDFALDWVGPVSDYRATNASLAVEGATLTGKLGVRVGDTLAFHDTDLRFTRLDTRTIAELFPALASPRQGYLTGQVAASGGFGAVTLDGDIAFDDPRTGRSRVLARGVVGGVGGALVARDLHLRLDPVQVALARVAAPSLPVAGTVTGTATLDGSTAARLTITGDVVHRAPTGRSRVVGSAAYASGSPPLVNADVRLSPLSLATVGLFAPAAGLTGTVAGPVRVTGPMRDLRVRAELTTPDGGGVTTTGALDLAARSPGYDLATTATLFDARSVTTRAPHTMLSADLAVAGRGVDPATMDAQATALVRASQYDSVRVDSAMLRATAAGGLLTLDTLALGMPGGAASAGGTFGLARGRTGDLRYAVAIDSLGELARLLPRADTGVVPPRPRILRTRLERAHADSMRLATATAVERAVTGRPLPRVPVDTPRAIPRSDLRGSVRAAGVLRGSIYGFGTTGSATARDLMAYGNSARSLQATYTWTGVRTPAARVEARVQGTTVVAGGFLLDTVAAAATYSKPNGTLTLAVRQDSQRVYDANARFALSPERNTLFLDRVRLRFDTTVYASRQPSVIHWGPAGVDIDSLDLRSRRGRGIFVDGRIPTGGSADLTIAVTQFQVADIMALLQSDIPASGLVSVVAQAQGTRAAPVFNGVFGLDRASYAGRPTPELHGTFGYRDATLTTALNGAREGEAPFLTARGAVPVNLALAGVTGSRVPRDRQIDAMARSDSLPLDLIPQVSTAVTNFGGRALLDVRVRGTVNNPDVQGRMALWNGTAKVVPLGIVPTDIAGVIRLAGDTLRIDSLVARSGGTVRVTGGIGLAGSLSNPRFALRAVARNALVVDNNQYGQLRADADLTMTGPFDRTDIGGRVRVRRGVLYIPEPSGKTLVGAGDPALFSVLDTAVASNRDLFPPTSPFLANMRMNLALTVDRDVFVRSTAANVEVYSDGDIRVTRERGGSTPRLDGVLLSDRGEYRFQSRRFQITRGSATFANLPEINPTLQVAGQYLVQLPSRPAFNIRILISGTLDQPKIALESDAQPPISQTDLLSYLAFNRSTTSLLMQEGSTLTSGGAGSGNLVGTGAAFAARQVSAAALGAVTDQVAGEAARALGADVFTITPVDVSLDAASFLRGMQVEFGKYVQTRTFLGMQLRPAPGSLQRPGVTLTHRFPGMSGYRLETSFAPRYLPRQPSLSINQIPQTTSAFGMFLVREWRF